MDEIDFRSCLSYDFVGLNRGSSLLSTISSAAHDIGFPLRLRIQVRSFDAMSEMIASNLGIGVLPLEHAFESSSPLALRQFGLWMGGQSEDCSLLQAPPEPCQAPGRSCRASEQTGGIRFACCGRVSLASIRPPGCPYIQRLGGNTPPHRSSSICTQLCVRGFSPLDAAAAGLNTGHEAQEPCEAILAASLQSQSQP
ncbi:LysR substrate-binding domain-containing protein [Cupriavidus basilensis]